MPRQPVPVEDSVLGTGVYDLTQASFLLGMDERQLLRWSHKTPKGLPPLLPPSHGWAYSFHDLVSLGVIAVMRQRGISTASVRLSIRLLQNRFDTPRPLAHRRIVRQLQTAGGSVLLADGEDISAGGQMAMLETVKSYLRRIEYGSGEMARLWKPERYISLDPEVQAGLPCVRHTRVPTDLLWSRVDRGEPVRDVAEDLELDAAQVRAAFRFEARLRGGEGLALVA